MDLAVHKLIFKFFLALEIIKIVVKKSFKVLDFGKGAEEQAKELDVCRFDEALHILLFADLKDVEIAVILHVLVGLVNLLRVNRVEP